MGALAIIAPMLAPLVKDLIVGAEKAITTPKSGEVKNTSVLASIRNFINGMITAGVKPGGQTIQQPSDDELRGFVESIFQMLQVNGKIPGATPGKTYLLRGTVTEIPV